MTESTSQVVNILNKPMKVCSSCKLSKSLYDDFYEVKSQRLNTCKDCKRAVNKKWRDENPATVSKLHKEYREEIKSDPVKYAEYLERKKVESRSDNGLTRHYKSKFGLTVDDVRSMLSKQNGLCANIGCSQDIYLRPENGQKKAVVDHCHTTGKVRGMLCTRCNSFLGYLEKDKNLVPGLMDYLNKSKG